MSKLVKKYCNEPWTLWLLICLCRQAKRQSWLKRVHDKIVENDLDRSGIVPDHQEWAYYYHGMGLCITGPNNEVIDVDFHDEDALTIDPYFFTTRIPKSREREENEIGYTFDEVVEHNLKNSFSLYLKNVKSDLAELDLEKIRLAMN